MRSVRIGIGAVGLVFLALSGAACNLIDFDRRNLQDDPPPPADDTPTPDPPRMCTPVVAEATPEYAAMCWHYCTMVEVTLHYAGNDVSPGVFARTCYEMRCAPRCVSKDLCIQQCDALRGAYQAACGGGEVGPGTICPVSVDDEVNVCLTGCDGALGPPPPDVTR